MANIIARVTLQKNKLKKAKVSKEVFSKLDPFSFSFFLYIFWQTTTKPIWSPDRYPRHALGGKWEEKGIFFQKAAKQKQKFICPRSEW